MKTRPAIGTFADFMCEEGVRPEYLAELDEQKTLQSCFDAPETEGNTFKGSERLRGSVQINQLAVLYVQTDGSNLGRCNQNAASHFP